MINQTLLIGQKSSNVATSNKLKFDTMTMWVISIHMSLEPLQTLFQTGQIYRCTPLSIKLSSVVGQVEHCGSFLKRKSWWPGSNKLHQLLLSNYTIVERKFNFFLWPKNCQSVFYIWTPPRHLKDQLFWRNSVTYMSQIHHRGMNSPPSLKQSFFFGTTVLVWGISQGHNLGLKYSD